MSTIYYNLRSSSAVLGVYCNQCNKCCSFFWSWPHDEVVFWTKNKEEILCPECAEKNSEKVYRKVLDRNDIPIHRSKFRTESFYDRQMFGNNTKNKKSYRYIFCTKEEEEDELSGRTPVPVISCKCGKCQEK
jgi:hypothetical protein